MPAMKSAARVLVPLLLAAAACGKGGAGQPGAGDKQLAAVDDDHDSAVDEATEHDSANLRAAAMREWYTESKGGIHGQIYTREYRQYLLQVARAEREKWADLMPGAKVPMLIGGSQWKSLGPTTATTGPNGGGGAAVIDSGRITAVIPDGTTRLFVATAGGGLWRRQNNTWTPLSETIGSLACGSLAMDPTNHNTLYLGLGDSFDGTGVGLLKSTDGGDTWGNPVFLGTSMQIPTIMVDPAATNIILAGTDQGLFRSTDSGATFNPVTINTGFATPTKVWSIASTGGHNFVLSLGTLPVDSEITTSGETWYSSNDGASWTQSTGLTTTTAIGRVTVASAPSSPTTVYAMAGQDNANSTNDLADIFKSTDGGKTWTALNVTAKKYSNTSGRVGGILNQQGWYNQVVLVDPANPSIAYFGGALLLAKTTDGGSTFRQMTDWLGGNGLAYVHADFHAGWLDSTGLYVGTDGGVYQSTNGGTSFDNSINNGLVTHLLYSVGSSPANKAAVIGGMQDNGTRVREGTTSTFDEVIGGDGIGAAINRTNAQLMLGSVYYDQIERSTDGGQTWLDGTSGIAEAGDSSNAPFLTRIITWEGAQSTGNEVYTFSNTKVYKSTDYAQSWTALPTPAISGSAVIRMINVAATDSKIVGVLGSGGVVELSKDGGSTWTQVASGKGTDPTALPNSDRSLSWIQFDVTNPNTIYIASVAPESTVNHLWKSTDFGAHWAALNGTGLPAGVPIDIIKSDPTPVAGQPDKVLYAATHLGIYKSTDSGATWARFGSGMPLVEVSDLYVSPDESLVRAATYGRGIWELQTPANDFSMTATPTTVTVAPGAAGTTSIKTTITNGVAQTVALTATGLPGGATAAFAPPSIQSGQSSTLTLTAGAATAPGTYTVTVTGTGTGVSHTVTVSFVVTAANDFSITANPSSLTMAPSSNGTVSIDTAVTAGSAQSIALTASGLPTGVTAAFSPSSVNAGTSSSLTLTADATAQPGSYTVTVTGTGASATHTTTVALTIAIGGGDFSLSVSPTTISVAPGGSGGATVSTAVVAGAAGSIDLSVTGLPAGATAAFSPMTVTAGGSSNLTITTSTTTPIGPATVTVTGTSGATTHSATITLDVETASGGDAGTGPGDTGNHGGCGCSSSSSLATTSSNGAMLLGVLAFALRRRRRAR